MLPFRDIIIKTELTSTRLSVTNLNNKIQMKTENMLDQKMLCNYWNIWQLDVSVWAGQLIYRNICNITTDQRYPIRWKSHKKTPSN